jgi:hypothetical protein
MAINSKIDPTKIGQSGSSSGLYLNDLKDLEELKFRAIGDIQVGYQYFQKTTKEDGSEGVKPVRSEEYPETIENPSKQPWDGQDSKPVQFMAMAIYDFADETIKIWQVTKKALMTGLMEIELDDDFGEIQDYDFKAKKVKTGTGTTDIEYSLLRLEKSEPTKEMLELYEKAEVNLSEYMAGTGGIGEKKKEEDIEVNNDDINPEDIPFK